MDKKNRQKHILFIFRTLGTGGSQKVQAFVANACAKKGYNVSILTMSNETNTLDLEKTIKIYTLEYDLVANLRNQYLKYFFARLIYVLKFRKLCKKINPDLICVFLIDIVRLTVFALRGTNYPIVASERADPGQFNKKKIKQYNKALNSCVGVAFQLEEASQYYDIKKEVFCEIIPNPSIVRNKNIKFRNNDTKELFIFGAGRLTKQKRFDVLINAFKYVNEKFPNYRLKLYGDGPEKQTLVNQIEKLGLLGKVDIMGDVKNIFQDVNEKSIFVLSSDYEGIPNVITEALINGIPCISTDCSPGGARLLLNEGNCGDIVKRGDSLELAKSIIKYICNPEYAAKKTLNGKEYIKMFEPEIIERKWLDFFGKVV